MKPHKTVDEQLNILKSRNVYIPRKSFARRILTYENYYYVINGYKTPFIASTQPDDTYKPGTSFHEIFALYSFDRRLREILFPELLRIEHSVKSIIIDVFSKHHGHDHTSYLRPNSFNTTPFDNFKRTNALIFDLLKLIDKQRSRHGAITHYMDKYQFVPIWVLSKVMTFGKINSFYGCMLLNDKIEVATAFNLQPSQFKSLVDFITIFRNKCAHGERVYCHLKDQKKPSPIPELPLHDKLNIPHNMKGYKHGTQDILALLIAMKYFLQPDRYANLIRRIDYALNIKFARRLHSIPCSDIQEVMGLLDKYDWMNILKKPVQ